MVRRRAVKLPGFADMHGDMNRQHRARSKGMIKGRKILWIIVDSTEVRHDADDLVPWLGGSTRLLRSIFDVSHATA